MNAVGPKMRGGPATRANASRDEDGAPPGYRFAGPTSISGADKLFS
jgi:hypothetical protein